MQHANVTVKDVARAAGVSPGTVSNALSGKRPVSEDTRRKILDAIAALDYRPNLVARSLVSRRSATLAVVDSGLELYGPSRTLVGIERRANELGYSLLLALLHSPEQTDVDGVLAELTARRVDGIIWAVHEVGDNRAWLSAERLQRLPPIIFLTMQERPHTALVSTDNFAGGALATQHLLDQGRRRIGCITGPLDWWEARRRRAGWADALARAGLPADPALVVEGDWTAASGEAAIRRLWEQAPDLDAVFTCNDQMALGVLRAAHLSGRAIPQELAVVGFDNMPESAYFWPPLTTVRQHLLDLGRLAVDNLHVCIESDSGAAVAARTLVTPELIVRQSSSPG